MGEEFKPQIVSLLDNMFDAQIGGVIRQYLPRFQYQTTAELYRCWDTLEKEEREIVHSSITESLSRAFGPDVGNLITEYLPSFHYNGWELEIVLRSMEKEELEIQERKGTELKSKKGSSKYRRAHSHSTHTNDYTESMLEMGNVMV